MGDLGIGCVDVFLVRANGLLFLVAITSQFRGQLPQIGAAAHRGFPLGGEGGQIGLFAGDLLGQGSGLGQQFGLAGQGLLSLCPEVCRQSLLLRHLLFRFGRALGIIFQTACQARQLTFQIFKILTERTQ